MTRSPQPSSWPGLPSALIEHDTFRARVKELSLIEMCPPGEAGCTTAIRIEQPGVRVSVVLNGYGEGYGGRRPVRVLDVRFEAPREPSDVQRRAVGDLVRKLSAPAPIDAAHPAAIEERLAAFLERAEGRPFHVITMPEGEPMARAFDHGERLAEVARWAERLGEPVTILERRGGPAVTWPVAFRGTGAELAPRAHELSEKLAGRYDLGVGEGDARLHLEAGLTARAEVVRRLTRWFVDRARARQVSRVEIDASGGVVAIRVGSVQEVKAQLEVVADRGVGPFTLRVAGRAEPVKPDKLSKLATVLRGNLLAGEQVAIETPRREPDDLTF